MNLKLTIFIALFCGLASSAIAQSNLFTGVQNRIVVFARFDGDPEFDTPKSNFESMFNGQENSLKSYFEAISNNKLTVNSLMFPNNSDINTSYELKYCYYCYDNTWKGNYPNCKGSDITSSSDINIAFIIKELAEKLESSQELLDASILDNNNDGYIDNFVIVLRGAARGSGKGIYNPHVGTISSTFTNTHGPIQIRGKTIHNYTITFERNSLDTHCRFLLNYMGFPIQYQNVSTRPRSAGAWDPMDGPELSYPLVYNRMKYTNSNWIDDIPEITETGEYSLSSADNTTNNAYKILSPDKQQYWVLEYRNNAVKWENNIPESGLIIYRVNTNYAGSVSVNPEIYLYRLDGTPNIAGDINNAAFSDINGRTDFNATSNPYPFFSDGSIANEPDITDIAFKDDKISFRVNSTYTDIQTAKTNDWNVFVIPGTRTLQVQSDEIEQISIFDLSGCLLKDCTIENNAIELPKWPTGIYFSHLRGKAIEKKCKFILK